MHMHMHMLCVHAHAHAHACRLRYRRQSEAAAGGCRRAQQQLYAAGGFRTTVSDGLWAAYRRSLELGGNDSNVGPDRTMDRTKK